MFDGTYPIKEGDRHADFTDKRPHKHDDERSPIILESTGFRWEDNPLPITIPADLDADDLPFAHEVR